MTVKSVLLAAAAAVGFAAAAPTDALSETWALAVTDVEGLERLQTEWGPFKAALEEATGETFEFFPVNSRTAAAEALRAETVDFVISGPAEYVVINKLTDAAPLIGLGRPDYHCAIVVRADSGINTCRRSAGPQGGLRRYRLDVEHALPDAVDGRLRRRPGQRGREGPHLAQHRP
jgi:phosphonate transport system substrate-binding protein